MSLARARTRAAALAGRAGRRRGTRRALRGLAVVLAAGALVAAAVAADAQETGWVEGASLNLRSGPGTQYRILATVKPGDRVQVLNRADAWTQVKNDAGDQGWMPAGFLAATAPPRLRVEQLEKETASLKEQLEKAQAEAKEAKESFERVDSRDGQQRAELDRLTRENMRMRAGERWVDWLTGASILGLGMAAGAIVRGLAGRGRARRLKL